MAISESLLPGTLDRGSRSGAPPNGGLQLSSGSKAASRRRRLASVSIPGASTLISSSGVGAVGTMVKALPSSSRKGRERTRSTPINTVGNKLPQHADKPLPELPGEKAEDDLRNDVQDNGVANDSVAGTVMGALPGKSLNTTVEELEGLYQTTGENALNHIPSSSPGQNTSVPSSDMTIQGGVNSLNFPTGSASNTYGPQDNERKMHQTLHSEDGGGITPYETIVDPDMRQMWKNMGWRDTVKIKPFVTALQNYYQDRATGDGESFLDGWALQYFTPKKAQAILEALDEDASGLITVLQLNNFTRSCPNDWSLPRWFAYWAIGWQITATDYCGKIEQIISTVFALREQVQPVNRGAVNKYLLAVWDSAMTLVQSIQRYSGPDTLKVMFESYVITEEERLRRNLEKFRYHIDDYDAVRSITGRGRIEQFIFPLLYLTLKRHLAIISLSRLYVIGKQELPDAVGTWSCITKATQVRVSHMEVVFKQRDLDPSVQFKRFARGLFEHLYEFGFVFSGDWMRTLPDPPAPDEDLSIPEPSEVLNHPLLIEQRFDRPPDDSLPIEAPIERAVRDTIMCAQDSIHFTARTSYICVDRQDAGLDPRVASTTASPSPQWDNLDVQSLSSILASRQGFESILNLRGDDAVSIADLLDQALGCSEIDVQERKKYTVALRKLCGACGILPTSHILSEDLKIVGDRPHMSGGFADVWPGTYRGREVAIKALRTYATDDIVKVKKRFFREALVWKRLSHPNVLAFLGVSTSVFPFCMVSNWMTHGNVVCYVKANPQANRLVLLSDVASGLNYLHLMDLVHGDLKGANILINKDRRACLADFGLMTILSEAHSGFSTTTSANSGGTVRWMAPELLNPEEFGFEQASRSKESDIYAVGMVIYEVMTGTVPFSQHGNLAVIPKVINGIRPERPTEAAVHGLSDAVWRVVEDCWCQQWNERSTVQVVLNQLNEATRYWDPSPQKIDSPLDPNVDSDVSSVVSDQLFDKQSSVSLCREGLNLASTDAATNIASQSVPDDIPHSQVYTNNSAESEPSPTSGKSEYSPSSRRPTSQRTSFFGKLRDLSKVVSLASSPSQRKTAGVPHDLHNASRSAVFTLNSTLQLEVSPKQKTREEKKPDIGIIVMGHNDSGKSTIAGHLIYTCGGGCGGKWKMDSPVGDSMKLEQSPFKYAWIFEKSETVRERGVSIDVSSSIMETPKHRVSVVDVRSHCSFVKQLADNKYRHCAIVVLSARDGEFEAGISENGQTRENLVLAFSLGIRQLVVVVNKMDTANWNQDRFTEIVDLTSAFVQDVGYQQEEIVYIPISGWHGDNVLERSDRMCSWYQGWEKETQKGSVTGYTLFEAIDALESPPQFSKPLRIPVDRVLSGNSGMVTMSGRVEAGIIKTGMSVMISPANVIGDVESVQLRRDRGERDSNISFIQIRHISFKNIRRGQIISGSEVSHAREAIWFLSRVVFLQNCDPFAPDCNLVLFVHTASVPCRFQEVVAVIDIRNGTPLQNKPKSFRRGDICIAKLAPSKPLCLEAYHDFPALGRFQLRERNNARRRRFSFSSLSPTRDSQAYLKSQDEGTVAVGIVESVEFAAT